MYGKPPILLGTSKDYFSRKKHVPDYSINIDMTDDLIHISDEKEVYEKELKPKFNFFYENGKLVYDTLEFCDLDGTKYY